MIICITGMPGAGKSTAGKILGKTGYRVYELGDVVRDMMREQGIKLTPESDRQFTTYLRRKYGKLVTIRYLLKKVKLNAKGRIVIVGFRSKAELDYVRKQTKIVTIAIVAPAKLRFERTKRRGRADAPRTLAEFVRDKDKKEARWGELGAIKSADYLVSGAGSVAGLRNAISEIVKMESSRAKGF